MSTGFQIPSLDEQRESVASLPGAVKTKAGASDDEIKYFQELHALYVRNQRMGIEPATIINLNPFALRVHHPLFQGLVVPACPVDKPFSMLVIRDVRYMPKNSEGQISPVDYAPFILAQEFESQAKSYGGVVVFRGDAEELQKEGHELLEHPRFKELYEAAKVRLLAHCRELKRNADNEWNTPARSGARNITDLHRNAVRILMRERQLAKPPEYLDATMEEAQVADSCPNCGSTPKKGAAMCQVCGFVIDPLKAWNLGAIMDPSHMALRRLSRSILQRLGISEEDIPETLEERNERMKADRQAKPHRRANSNKGAAGEQDKE